MNLKEQYSFINKKKLKVNKLWLFFAWLFGKRTFGVDVLGGIKYTTYFVYFRKTLYCYKEEKEIIK